ncbi:FkbM family methyltransferase [Roseobacteraceae bacterium S113]
MSVMQMDAPETTGADYFDIDAARAALAEGRPVTFPAMQIVRSRIDGRDMTFACNFERDPIQNAHRAGGFYEAQDLAAIMARLPGAARVLDVGANVGNHALYFATHGASHVTVIEPNPLAMAPLVANVVLNALTDIISLDALGVGLGAASETGFAMKRHDRNLGATKMKRGQGGNLAVHAGDDLFAQTHFDLIKIDVEGMEMEVLAGLEATITRTRPVLFVEVDDAHGPAFDGWLAQRGYTSVQTFRHGAGNLNHLALPTQEAV